MELNPDFPIAYSRVVNTNLLLDRLPEAERGLQRAAQRKLEMPNFLAFRHTIGVMKGDQEQMSRAIAEAQGKRLAEHWVAHLEALTLARSGRLQAARRSSTRAVDLAQQEGDRELAAKYQAARAVWEAACGNAAEGKKYAISALERSKGRDVEFTAALAHGLSGGFPQSEALADDLDKRFPEDTFAKFTHVPVLRGLAALRRGKPVESVELLQTALRYELAVNGLNFPQFYLGGLYAAYVRGGYGLTEEQRWEQHITAVAEHVLRSEAVEQFSAVISINSARPREPTVGGEVERRRPPRVDAEPRNQRCHV